MRQISKFCTITLAYIYTLNTSIMLLDVVYVTFFHVYDIFLLCLISFFFKTLNCIFHKVLVETYRYLSRAKIVLIIVIKS